VPSFYRRPEVCPVDTAHRRFRALASVSFVGWPMARRALALPSIGPRARSIFGSIHGAPQLVEPYSRSISSLVSGCAALATV
jgi:hypothetical protein